MSFNTWFWPVWRLRCILGLDVPPPLPHQFYALFPAPPGWACTRREPLDFMMQGKINRGWHTDHPAGCHSIRTNHSPPPPSPIFLQARCPFCHPTDSVKALMQYTWTYNTYNWTPLEHVNNFFVSLSPPQYVPFTEEKMWNVLWKWTIFRGGLRGPEVLVTASHGVSHKFVTIMSQLYLHSNFIQLHF